MFLNKILGKLRSEEKIRHKNTICSSYFATTKTLSLYSADESLAGNSNLKIITTVITNDFGMEIIRQKKVFIATNTLLLLLFNFVLKKII